MLTCCGNTMLCCCCAYTKHNHTQELGIPTANVDADALRHSLAEAVTGIYCGWASIGQSGQVCKGLCVGVLSSMRLHWAFTRRALTAAASVSETAEKGREGATLVACVLCCSCAAI